MTGPTRVLLAFLLALAPAATGLVADTEPLPFTGRGAFVPTPVDAPFLDAVRAGPAAETDVYQLAAHAAGARPGQVVADVGAGDGRHLTALSEAVGAEGRVIATEISESRLPGLRSRADALRNLTVLQAEPDDVGLPAGEVDVLLLSDVYQFVRVLDGRKGQDQAAFLASVQRALAPGGVVVVTYVTSSLMRDEAERAELLAGTLSDFVDAGFLPGRRWLVRDPMWPRAVLEFRWPGPLDPQPGDGLTEYMGRTIAGTMGAAGAPWLTRREREQEEGTEAFLAALRVPEGGVVADVGCGNGYHVLPLARLVGPEGRVLAVDIQAAMLELLSARVAEAGLENVLPVLGTVADPRLPPDSCDLVIMADVYHELSHPEEVLGVIRRALRHNGRLALLEFRAEDPEVPIKRLHKMSKRQILRELEANGFRPAGGHDDLPWQHLLFFEVAP